TDFHPAVEAEAASAHAEMMDQGQARFDTGDAGAGLARLARLWAVIARDDVERAIGQSLPQRGLVMRLPDGRANPDRVAAFGRARVVITGVDEIGHTPFTVHSLHTRFRQANLAHALLTTLMV